ncbi:hypothetical protein BN1321_420012 [Staphylococcus aureus]|uniref:Uncharacterized protein n=1 Tax=Staphylococcus aureus TaxID=1280 RepID=A0A0U1MT89_STAAU|nr:hypothetical protein BN1321_420012 [Staphylococcus aureus]
MSVHFLKYRKMITYNIYSDVFTNNGSKQYKMITQKFPSTR